MSGTLNKTYVASSVHSNSPDSVSLGIALPDCGCGGGTTILSIPHGLGIAAGDPGGHGRALDCATVTGGGAPKEVVAGALVPVAGRTQWSADCSPPSSCCSFGSYWVFSSRAISRSSLSPNSPPIKVGSPTTITSCTTDRQDINIIARHTVAISPHTHHIHNAVLVTDFHMQVRAAD